MGEPAMTTTVQQERAFQALGQLAVAYFDRMAVSDYPRAGKVLSVFAYTFNANRDAIVEHIAARAPAVPSHLPAQLHSFFDTAGTSTPENQPAWRMREVLELVLVSLGTPSAQMRTMPQVAVSLAGWWLGGAAAQVERALGRPFLSLSTAVAQMPIASLDQLSSMIDRTIETGEMSWSLPPAPAATPAPTVPTPPPAPTQITPQGGDLFTIPGNRARFVMPTWGWWAIGLGVVAAAGVVTWGIVDQGWLKKFSGGSSSSARAPTRRRKRR